MWPVQRTRLLSFASCTSWYASFDLRVRGFSTRTFFPALRKSEATSKWDASRSSANVQSLTDYLLSPIPRPDDGDSERFHAPSLPSGFRNPDERPLELFERPD